MGLMRFLVAPSNRISAEAASRAYLIGMDQTPWLGRVQLQDGILSVGRSESDSGCLCVPFAVDGRGEIALTTGTLIERFQPYNLVVELARGKINQLRAQINEWQLLGMALKEHHLAALHAATAHLSRAVTAQHDPLVAAQHAERALRAALELSDALTTRYVNKMISARRRQSGQLTTLLGADLGSRLLRAEVSRQFLKTFNAATVPLVWRDIETQEGAYRWDVYDRQIEWCRQNGIKVIAGPLLEFDNRGLPDWLAIWMGDFDNMLTFVSDYVETAVQRYRGKVDVWQCATRVNLGDVLGLGDEDRLRLAIRAFEIARRLDPTSRAIITFDQPWGEYLGHSQRDLSPLYFADILVRSGIEVSGIGIELNVSYAPGGSYLRDSLEFSRLIDRWSTLGLPLWVFLTVPAGQGEDAKAHSRARPVGGPAPDGWTPEAQRQWIRHVAPLLLAKPSVQGVIYNELCDAHTHEFPHAGLYAQDEAARPALATLAKVRKKYLGR